MSALATNLRAFLKDNYRLSDGDLTTDSALFSTGLLDSFAMVELVSFVEKEATVRIKAKDLTLENFDSIERIIAYVSAR